jgi:uncharacterized membrane protein YeiH
MAALFIGLNIATTPISLYVLLVGIVGLRMCSLFYKWRLPFRSLRQERGTEM